MTQIKATVGSIDLVPLVIYERGVALLFGRWVEDKCQLFSIGEWRDVVDYHLHCGAPHCHAVLFLASNTK